MENRTGGFALDYRALQIQRRLTDELYNTPGEVYLDDTTVSIVTQKCFFTSRLMSHPKVSVPLKRFLLTEEYCPEAWKPFDLYLIRDEVLVFYIGQSHSAVGRVWEHLLGGFKGHSSVGRFIWNNWPRSMNFIIELMNSKSAEFDRVGNDLNAAERWLIEQSSPCFNVSLNSQPTPLPEGYFAANAKPRRSLRRLIYEAARAVQADEQKRMLEEWV